MAALHAVPIELDKLRHIRYRFNDIADMQAIMPDVFKRDIAQLPTLRLFLWAGLKHEDPALTTTAVGELIEEYLEKGGRIPDLADSVTKAMEESAFFQSTKGSGPDLQKEGKIPKNLRRRG
jgi:hypothetical protein